ncbi:NUDIX domain-containing protein [Rhizobium ruizarguesonis]|nr:NUDIX hydrolase [Rhizobium ruizarguesonis]
MKTSEQGAGPDIITVDSREVYANRWMTVREDKILRRDGSPGLYGYVDKPDFVMILPFDRGLVHLVQQFRYPIKSRQWEFPQGSWEEKPDADPGELARGELQEETGLIAGSLIRIGTIYPLYGTVTQRCHVFLATDLTPGDNKLEHEEQDLVRATVSVDELQRMILDGDLQDAGTIAAFGLARLRKLL